MKIARESPAVWPWVAGLLLFAVLAWGVIEVLRVNGAVEAAPAESAQTSAPTIPGLLRTG